MSDGTFYGYIALLTFSGILLGVLAGVGFGQTRTSRVIAGLFAAAFLIYAVYLLLFFDGGTVVISYYAFIVPIIAVVQAVKARKARREAQTSSFYAPPAGPFPPAGPAASYPPADPNAGYQQAPYPPAAHPTTGQGAAYPPASYPAAGQGGPPAPQR